ncbi:outer membrane protein transport protein [Verrucomicrobiaceae bacterium 5K15]|uniref:Outer membrane protein transport protein n=1 Tax=Oceaniferula flava TaxID=2800421 RepID=A0AAE2VDI4_9BACT|nr:outer membrane protein transport protein [Oceaniferula flavus]MBK1854654.1 outer membrane protein transport protein [Oceaniferula flavus]MBM1135960.1 outer membrane protein transport protein [Oceaniferula flavus]
MKRTSPPSLTLSAVLLGATCAPLLGAGFQLAERSATGLGRAFSGEAAIADDASVLASNPAGMILLEDGALSTGLHYIHPSVDAYGITPSGSTSDSNIAEDALVPYFYYTRKLNQDWSIGLGMFSGFGLATDYSTSFASQAGTETSEILTVTINPSLAYRINDRWSIGAGLDFTYVKGKLTALNTSTDMVPGDVGATLFDLEGDDWAYGWNIGVLFELSEKTRIGLHYRSSFDLEIEGEASGDLVSLTGVYERDATLEVELPDTVELSIYHEINDQWSIHGDVLWTNWSKFKELAPVVHPAIDGSLLVEENWEDTFRYAIGVTYRHSDRVTYRAGVALDQSPVSHSHRTLRIPDADRLWVSIGATIKLNECYNLDVGYTHVFADDAHVDFESTGGNEGQFRGTASGDVDIFGIGISGTF